MNSKSYNKNRNGAFVRFQRARVIKRKCKIARHMWFGPGGDKSFSPKQMGRLAKGKVHCSCWMCSAKERNHGPKLSYRKKLEAMKSELLDTNE